MATSNDTSVFVQIELLDVIPRSTAMAKLVLAVGEPRPSVISRPAMAHLFQLVINIY